MKLAEYLTNRGISHKAFADDLGVSQVTVTRYAGDRRFPRREHLQKISELTKGEVTPNDFLAPAASKPSATAPSEPASAA